MFENKTFKTKMLNKCFINVYNVNLYGCASWRNFLKDVTIWFAGFRFSYGILEPVHGVDTENPHQKAFLKTLLYLSYD